MKTHKILYTTKNKNQNQRNKNKNLIPTSPDFFPYVTHNPPHGPFLRLILTASAAIRRLHLRHPRLFYLRGDFGPLPITRTGNRPGSGPGVPLLPLFLTVLAGFALSQCFFISVDDFVYDLPIWRGIPSHPVAGVAPETVAGENWRVIGTAPCGGGFLVGRLAAVAGEVVDGGEVVGEGGDEVG